jgi:hypothetical protein
LLIAVVLQLFHHAGRLPSVLLSTEKAVDEVHRWEQRFSHFIELYGSHFHRIFSLPSFLSFFLFSFVLIQPTHLNLFLFLHRHAVDATT